MVLPVLDGLLSELAGPRRRRVIVAGRLDGIRLHEGVEVLDLDDPPEPRRSAAVVFVAEDRLDLRATAFPRLGRTRTVVCVLRTADAALPGPHLPTWPELTDQDARLDGGGSITVQRFAEVVPAHEVLAGLAAAAADDRRVSGGRGLVIGFVRGDGQPVPPADPTYVEITPETRIADLVVPPDVVLSSRPLRLDESPVTGRTPLVVDARGDEFVDEGLIDAAGPRSSYGWRQRLAAAAGLELPGPLPRSDSSVAWWGARPEPASPIGFDPSATEPVRDLSALDAEVAIRELVASLRPALGVRVDTDTRPRLADQLAAAGVPLLRDGDTVDLTDPVAREEHSIVVRRAALDAAGGRARSGPPVSILLATRRPEMLDHALAQVARQRGAELELVLAGHGFAPDPGRVRELLGAVPFELVPQPADSLFGRVLAEASAVAGGEVLLKMDDDDWYGPEVVADLLRARAYSGAPVVGSAAEYVYLSDRDVTVKQSFPAEKYTNFVAGGTLMIDAALLRQVGGFRPVRRYVDAQLLAGVRAVGAAIYRMHGLGYLLRRNPTGHTWTMASDELLEDSAVTQPGFRPSRLLEYDAG
jgi:hypothetical protein